MLLRLICTLLFLCIALPAEGQSARLQAQDNVKSKSQSTSTRCTKKEPTITEEQAISIAKAEVLKRIGAEEAKDFTDYVAILSSRKYSSTAYWSVLTSPDTRIIDAHITIRMDRCGKVLVFKQGL
jgi:hypothetical protein